MSYTAAHHQGAIKVFQLNSEVHYINSLRLESSVLNNTQ